jgi:phosphatidylglycerophosphatase A
VTRFLAWATRALASCLYLSYLPSCWRGSVTRFTGAGLIGSAAGVLTANRLPQNPISTWIVLLGAFCVSVAVSDYAEELMGRKDDPRIVIDEWMGMWVAIAFLPRTLPTLALAFVLFRIFDVMKPSWIRRSGELPGGWGIVMDDVLAGAAANVLLRLIGTIHPL